MAEELNVTSSSGYLASIFSPDVYHCPDVIGYRWVIAGRLLQRINLTLYDFSRPPPPPPNPPYAVAPFKDERPSPPGIRVEESSIVDKCRREFGVIEDSAVSRPTIICAGGGRRRDATGRISHLYLSQGNVVRIWLPNDVISRHDNHKSTDRFLIHYAVIGCAFPTLPELTWFKSETDWHGIMGCVHVNITWPVECKDGIWNSSSTAINCSGVATEKAEENELTIGPIRVAFDRSKANQERVFNNETEVPDYAGFVILAITGLLILIVIMIIIAGLRNCSFRRESNRVLCPEAAALRQTSGEALEADFKLEGLSSKSRMTSGSHSLVKQLSTPRQLPPSSSRQNYFRAADDSV